MKKILSAISTLFVLTFTQAQIDGLAHINIQSKDVEKAKKFYINNLQFKEIYYKDNSDKEGHITRFSFLQSGTCILEIMQPSDTSSVKTKVSGVIPHFALEVTNIEKIVTELKSNGIQFKTGLFERTDFLGGIKGIFFYGPEGEEIELLEYTGKKPF
jgi:lactoylglutathione lyase